MVSVITLRTYISARLPRTETSQGVVLNVTPSRSAPFRCCLIHLWFLSPAVQRYLRKDRNAQPPCRRLCDFFRVGIASLALGSVGLAQRPTARPSLHSPRDSSREPHLYCSGRQAADTRGCLRLGDKGTGPFRVWLSSLVVERGIEGIDEYPPFVAHVETLRDDGYFVSPFEVASPD